MPERSGENPRNPQNEEEISRRQFLRRLSYVLGVSSAFLVGSGAGVVINSVTTDSEIIKYKLPMEANPSDENIAFTRIVGVIAGVGTSIGGLIMAYASYHLHRENSENTPPPQS